MSGFKYSALVFMGAALWGIEALFINPLADGGLTPLQISFLGASLAFIVVLIWTLIRKPSALKASLPVLGLLALNALVVDVAFNTLYYSTIIHSQASVAAMLAYTSPVFVMILSRVIFKEHMTGRKYICLIMTVVGCVFVTGFIGEASPIPLAALMTGLGAGLSYAVFTILTRFTSQRCSALTVLLYTLFFGAVLLLPLSHPASIAHALRQDHSLIPYVLLFGPVCNALANGLYTWGVSGITANKAAILAASEPLTGALVGMIIYGESHEPLKLFGMILVLTSIIYQGLGTVKDESVRLQRSDEGDDTL